MLYIKSNKSLAILNQNIFYNKNQLKMAIEDANEKHNVGGLIIDKIINILSILLFSAKKKEYLDWSSSLDKGFIVAQKN